MPFLIPCPLCLGRKVIGRGTCELACPTCLGTGGLAKQASELTPAEAHAFREELIPIPPDPAAEYVIESTRANLTTVLSGRFIEAVHFPATGLRAIDLVNTRGFAVRITPEFRGGRFHNLNAIPTPKGIMCPAPPTAEPES